MLFTSPNSEGASKSILIVDDDETLVELLSMMFEKYDFKVFKSENGLDALDILSSNDIDFVLTDIQMPVMGGRVLSQLIRNNSPSTKIAVMTGGKPHLAMKLLNDGIADYFFPKPFNSKNICEILMAEAEIA